MYSRFIFILFSSAVLCQQSYKSIHQIELEYNNESFIEPLYKAYTGPADPLSKTKKKISRKKSMQLIKINQHYTKPKI